MGYPFKDAFKVWFYSRLDNNIQYFMLEHSGLSSLWLLRWLLMQQSIYLLSKLSIVLPEYGALT